MKIYIAMPYGRRRNEPLSKIRQNVADAIQVARELILKGHVPFCPHLYHYVHMDWEDTPDEDRWLGICITWLGWCDAVLSIDPEGTSTGVQIETDIARLDYLLPIYYSLEDVPPEEVFPDA